MRNFLKNWYIGSSIISAIFLTILIFLRILGFLQYHEFLIVLAGGSFSSALFFVFGFLFNKRISERISRLNDVLESYLNSDGKELYSNSSSGDEFERLCAKVENALFELKSSERLRNDFVSSMSHELRTPLTAIKGWAETMKVGELIDFSTVRKGLEVISKEASRLSHIVDEILDFSSATNGNLVFNMEVIDILAEIEDSICLFKERASVEKKIFNYIIPKSPLYVYGDASRLKQVFINLVDNSFKYTDSGGTIEINVSEENEKLIFKVSDTGCGIDKSEIPKVTQKFYKPKKTDYNRNTSGFGIGLAIVKEITDAHKGSIQISSEPKIGTVVKVFLNLVDMDKENSLK